MKLFLPILFILIGSVSHSQITTAVIKANFGVEADLESNRFINSTLSNDDWFYGVSGPGEFVIDTTGAAYILNQYAVNPATRMQPFFRNMRFPQFSTVNNRILIDGIFIRDHHGDDSTVFAAGSNKNGMSPASWSCPVSQGIPDKNDILDMMMHVRREGPNLTDSLWLFGGVSIENTTGNRYFDFEMYQTDIYYDKTTRLFYNYGPDAGHTTWEFDAAGNILKAGDIIFTAEYSSSSLSNVEARIWVNKASLLITPAVFNWGGTFDGASAGATFGYANIYPKTPGDFYTGLQCANNTWAGPFQLVRQNNTVVTNYTTRQFMEFSVNLTKLGLDPLVTNNNPCGLPFRKILTKSRASTSFTAELKDFVGPFSFFRVPAVDASADAPILCGPFATSQINVDNAVFTSVYIWNTPDGNIIGTNIGPTIEVDQPGTYIVNQELLDSCGSTYASDTVVITYDSTCSVLQSFLKGFSGSYHTSANLYWTVLNDESVAYYEVERSSDGVGFSKLASVYSDHSGSYTFTDNSFLTGDAVYYRLKIRDINGRVKYSNILRLSIQNGGSGTLKIAPNPVKDYLQVSIHSERKKNIQLQIYNNAGGLVRSFQYTVQEGSNTIQLNGFDRLSRGVYLVQAIAENDIYREKIVVIK